MENQKSQYRRTVPLRLRLRRCLMHIAVGILNAMMFDLKWLCEVFAVQSSHFAQYSCQIAIVFFLAFFIYELVEDLRIKDCAYIDILGWLFGYPLWFAVRILFT